jgi:hypothetical protein
MEALKELSRLALDRKRQQHPLFPEHALVKPKYSDKDANGLTKCILDYIRLSGGYAVRINSQGQYNERLGQWTKGTTTRGTADIHACLNGKHLSIEIKVGRDQQSDHQKEAQNEIEQAGGLYFIARNFQAFADWLSGKRKGGEL